MATVKEIIALEDKVSPSLSKIEQQALANVKAYERLNKANMQLNDEMDRMEKAGLKNTEMFNQLTEISAKYADEIEAYIIGTKNAEIETENMGKSAIELNQSLELLGKAWNVLNGVMQKANELMELNNKQFNSEFTLATKMRTSLGASQENIQSMLDYSKSLQQVSIISDEVINSGAKMLATSASSTENLRKLTEATINASIGEYGLEAATSGYTSMAGYFQRAIEGSASMLVRNKILTQEQADELDNISSKVARENRLIEIMTDRYGNLNEVIANTPQGKIIQANNALAEMGETLGSKVTPYIAAFKEAVVNLLQPAVKWISDNISWLAPIFITLTGVIGAVIVAFTIWSVVNWITSASVWAVLSPILLVIGAILLVIGIIAIAVNAVNKATGSTISAVGIVTSVVFMLGAFIYNSFIVPTWNAIAAFVNFFANCFNDPVTSIKLLWRDLAITILNIINRIASAIDYLFGTSMSSTITGWISALQAQEEEIKKASNYEEVMTKLDYQDYKEAALAGYNFGKGIEDNINNGIANMDDWLNNLNATIGLDTTSSKALQVTTNDKLLSDEDVQLLLDVATRDYKLNYQQITPNITLTFGDIRETADIDNILDEVADRLEEIMDGNLEVAYNG